MTKAQLSAALLALLAAATLAACKPKPAPDAEAASNSAAATNASLAAWDAAVNTSNAVTSNATAP